MKKIVLAFFILVFLSSVLPEEDSFRFVVLGDNRPDQGGRQPQIFSDIVEEINLISPDFAVHTGDFVFGYDTDEEGLRQMYLEFDRIAKRLTMPLHLAVGNHDYGDGMTDVFQGFYGSPYYSFDYKNSHFIVLSTEEPEMAGGIGKNQMAWLAEDLRKTGRENIFVFLHRPLYSKMNPDFDPSKHMSFYSRQNRDEVVSLLEEYKVGYVFEGHEHFYDRHVEGGIIYIITAGAGAPLYEDGFYHYILVEVSGNEIREYVIEPHKIKSAHKGSLFSESILLENRLSLPIRLDGVAFEDGRKISIMLLPDETKDVEKKKMTNIYACASAVAILLALIVFILRRRSFSRS